MDTAIGVHLHEIERLGKLMMDQAESSTHSALRRDLLKSAEKLCIALQSPGQVIEQQLFGVISPNAILFKNAW